MAWTPSLASGFLAATSPLSIWWRVAILLATIYAQGLYLLSSLSDALTIDTVITRIVSTFLGAGVVSGVQAHALLSPLLTSWPAHPPPPATPFAV
jgi:hypothetical protein